MGVVVELADKRAEREVSEINVSEIRWMIPRMQPGSYARFEAEALLYIGEQLNAVRGTPRFAEVRAELRAELSRGEFWKRLWK